MARTREVFEASTDFTLAVEEEFQLLDPETRSLTQRYTEFRALTDEDPVLADAVAGELIESEIEIRSGKSDTWAAAVASQQEARRRSRCAATASANVSPRPERISISDSISSPATESARIGSAAAAAANSS